jgi:23S rRNA (cytidine2498-2'-O)-methyltransferase
MYTAYLSPIDFKQQLKNELSNITHEFDRLLVTSTDAQNVYWAQNIWYDAQFITFTSISDAAKKLKSLHGLWSHYPYKNIRKAELIQEKLPFFKPKRLQFPSPCPKAPLGAWTLIDDQTMLVSKRTSSPFANGEALFIESKIPPSRAYLKLYEALTLIGEHPTPSERCLEVGASPGSWTWVLNQLQTNIVAVDRAPLDPMFSNAKNIQILQKDAFSLLPKDLPKIDWIFSDIICYPEKLLQWIHKWLSLDINFICTIKFQGTNDYSIVQEFENIANSKVCHLYNNKHELTWIYTPKIKKQI